tara:strand:+ start:3470 stop:3829 length:360 start_codon:yes stop_codon:yes gene_type:complete
MALITLTFTSPLNTSCQVGDIAHYVATTTEAGFEVSSGNVVEIGEIRQIAGTTSAPQVLCETTANGDLDNTTKFILFSKNNKANLSSMLGYYAEVKLTCDATTEAEIFSVGMDIFESSK